MTTIAYKDGIIAFDSRITDGYNTIISDDYRKIYTANGCDFVFCGSVPDWQKFIDCWDNPSEGRNLEANAFVWDGAKLWYCGSNNNGIWKSPVYSHRASGSGRYHALTAMDMGATAKEAIKMAMKRDPFTGGKIRTFRITM